ncbi:MAG: NapC/NirT family cytochrome c [Thermodesulfobacteriota bacterium]
MAKEGRKTHVIVALVTLVASILVFKVVGYTSHRLNTDPGVCNICHEKMIKYSFDDYKGNSFSSSKVTSGARIGCAECHPYPFREFQKSTHYNNPSGVRPGCISCHEPHSMFQLIRFKFLYINSGSQGDSAFHNISGVIMDKELWEKRRIELAGKVREKLLATDSAKCRDCHDRALLKPTSKTIERAHKKMETQNKTCIDCHYDLVHAEVPWDDGEDDDDDDDDEDDEDED